MTSASRASIRHGERGRHLLALAVLALLVLALLPVRATTWAGHAAGLATMVVAPISHPFARLGRLLVPARVVAEQRSTEELARQLDDERTRRLRAERENDQLRSTIEQLSRGAAVAPDVPVRQVIRQVVEPSPRLMRVRIEDADGVTNNAVATASAVQLVGRVLRVDGRTCLVQPITAREAPRLRGEIELDDSGRSRLACLLAPGDDGVLRGEVEAGPTEGSAGASGTGGGLAPGKIVRLGDDQWPRHAQMLIIGRVESIEPHERQPLRKVVTVRPTVDLRRLSEIVLRLPDTSGDKPAAARPGATGRASP